MNNSSVSIAIGCHGDCSPVLAGEVTISTMILTVIVTIASGECPDTCKGGSDIHKEIIGS